MTSGQYSTDYPQNMSSPCKVLPSPAPCRCMLMSAVPLFTRERQHVIATLKGHTSEICGLKWSPSGSQLASGGNDNLLNVWNGTMPGRPTFRLDAHSAAVKALAWCPWQSNLLASGGGTADRSIKFWNTSNGNLLNSVDTNSQVCSLLWNTHEREILSSHGFSENQLCLWRYPTMVKTAEFTGHTSRVLHMSQSPDGMTVCSAAADETLRFWSCFSDNSTQAAKVRRLLLHSCFERKIYVDMELAFLV